MILGRVPGPRQAPLLWASGVLSAALLGWMNLSFALPFAGVTGGRSIPDLDIESSGQGLLALRSLLETRPEAAELLRAMHLGPDLVLPAVLGLFLALLTRRLATGASLYGRPAEGLLPVLLALPIGYAAFDYVENVTSLMLFPPASPAPGTAGLLAEILSWLTRVKFAALVISGILILRLAFGPKAANDS
ncbi:hypothetical protein H6M51_09635 [Rhizobium sp. AQ_MP]|uniref:hypothetical protein n=1 Tax=Rhizobium sp. AQ_MP TaxID=2761536 RepID=UPI00163A08A8|nr:hypothetical protein [Rhizobium sp. AQ_MP]MBC2773125.1 hypothetical protein [Rhizobium sp. AQ_MP]